MKEIAKLAYAHESHVRDCALCEALSRPSQENVYRRFIEEVDAMVIEADEPAAAVMGRLTRAVKRAQMVSDGELKSPVERGWAETTTAGGVRNLQRTTLESSSSPAREATE